MNKVLLSLKQFPDALSDAWKQAAKIKIPGEYRESETIVCCGMGGSSLAAHLIKSIYFDRLSRPFEIVRNYHLPNYVGEKSLVILISYSGNTEEVLSCLQEAEEKRAKILGISTGGKLINVAQKRGIPYFLIKPNFNPSGQPRFGLPYTLFSLLAVLEKIGEIDKIKEIGEIEEKLKDFNENEAKRVAKRLWGKIPVIISGEHLSGNAHVFANQINETSKNFAVYFLLPELNHHLLEGLAEPKEVCQRLIFLFLKSNLYSPKIQKRLLLTKEVVRKNKIETLEFSPSLNSPLAQSLETLQFSSFVSYHLSLLNKKDPLKIPWVEYFKRKLLSS